MRDEAMKKGEDEKMLLGGVLYIGKKRGEMM